MPKNDTPAFDLTKETKAAALLIEQMKMITGGASDEDATLVNDMIEGETNLHDAIESALELIAMDAAHVAALAARKKALDERMERKKHRGVGIRQAILNALDTIGQKKIEFAGCTLTRKALPAKLMITDESKLPAKFFVTPPPPPPELDTKAVIVYMKARAEALKEAMEKPESERQAAMKAAEAAYPAIPGAELSNGGETLQIREK